MATSTNYGWTEPDNTDLVTNGALAIRTLGNAIDTSLWNSGFGQAGKNKIINGDFNINQRAFTTATTSGTYMFDRFVTSFTGGTVTYTAQTFTTGAAPVAGYEGKNFIDVATTGQSAAGDFARLAQSIESVRTLANQPVTISFWAKAASGTPKVAVETQQVFGSGGSPSAAVNTYFGQATLSTAWARYSVTTTLPSISGKTIGTANDDRVQVNFYTSAGTTFNSRTGSLGIQTATISFWGVQVEYGSKATPFQTASGGSIQGELAMCQRYYYRAIADQAYSVFGWGAAESTTGITCTVPLPVTMRVTPTSLDSSNIAPFLGGSVLTPSATVLSTNESSRQTPGILFTVTGAVNTSLYRVVANNSTAAYVGFSAEL